MTLKKALITFVAVTSLGLSGTASAAMPTEYSAAQPGIIAVLIGLLLPAVQKVR